MKYTISLALLVFATQVGAHDVYVDATGLVVYGHPGQHEPYPASKLRSVQAIGADGQIRLPGIERRNEMSYLNTEGAAVIHVDFDNGLFAKTPEAGKFVPGGRDQHPGATEVRNFVKYGRSVFVFADPALKPSGAKFEIVPLRAPADGLLAVEVRFEGQPLAAAVVSHGDSTSVADASGRVMLPHAPDAPQLYTSRHEQPGVGAVDRVVYGAALWVAP